MEQSKKSSLVVARSILNNKLISKKLERYLKVGVGGGLGMGSGWKQHFHDAGIAWELLLKGVLEMRICLLFPGRESFHG